MAERSNNSTTSANTTQKGGGPDQSIGNQQGTVQTGAQNGGGENIEDRQDDQYTEDLRNSGQRKSREE
jgi:hypothetical protein